MPKKALYAQLVILTLFLSISYVGQKIPPNELYFINYLLGFELLWICKKVDFGVNLKSFMIV